MKINDLMILNPDRIGEIIQTAVSLGYNSGLDYTLQVLTGKMDKGEQKEKGEVLQKLALDKAIEMACDVMMPSVVVSTMEVIKRLSEEEAKVMKKDNFNLSYEYCWRQTAFPYVNCAKCVGNTVYIFTCRPGRLDK